MKLWVSILVTVLVTAGISGGGTYYFVNKKVTADKDSLQSQITELEKKLAEKEAATTVASETADWKTYINSSYKFSFKYPSNFYTASPDGYPDTTYISTSPISIPKESEGPLVPIFASVDDRTSVQQVVDMGKDSFVTDGYEVSDAVINGVNFTKVSGIANDNGYIQGKQNIQYLTLRNKKVIRLTFIGGLGVDLEIFEKIVDTFELTE